MRERSSSESSWMERGEGADTPDSHHRLTPNLGPKNVNSSLTNVPLSSPVEPPNQRFGTEDPPFEDKIRLPPPSSSQTRPLPAINGEIWSEDSTLWVCFRVTLRFNSKCQLAVITGGGGSSCVSLQDLCQMRHFLHRHVVRQTKKEALLSHLLG